MATVIKFLDDETAIAVDESPEEVQAAFNAAQGLPFALTRNTTGARVYLNPAAIALWYEREEGSREMPRRG